MSTYRSVSRGYIFFMYMIIVILLIRIRSVTFLRYVLIKSTCMNFIERKALFYSLSQVIASIAFWWFLIKLHIPVKEIQLKSLKGNISKISSLNNYPFPLRKIHRNENRFLTEIYNGECLHLFSIRNTLGIHRAIF